MPRKRVAAPVAVQEETPATVEVTLPVRRRRQEPGPDGRAQSAEPVPKSRTPRITRLMALAIKLQDMVDRGEVRDYADIARLGYVTRARLTQIMNLLLLAPEIQEDILAFDSIATGEEAISERHVRPIVTYPNWQRQRSAWNALRSR